MGFKDHSDLRDKMNKAIGIEEIKLVMGELKERWKKISKKDKLGWYFK